MRIANVKCPSTAWAGLGMVLAGLLVTSGWRELFLFATGSFDCTVTGQYFSPTDQVGNVLGHWGMGVKIPASVAAGSAILTMTLGSFGPWGCPTTGIDALARS